ncbi:MAG TPA: hypothetical protein VG844_07180 [Terracidiphilus sp.]|nr:hypothetical protein [Terracidiphilus sp.]
MSFTTRLSRKELNPDPPKPPDPRDTAMQEAAARTLGDLARSSPPTIPTVAGRLPDTAVKILAEYHMEALRYGLHVHHGDASGADNYAANCWRQALPELSTHRDVLTFIACIAWGARNRIIAPQDAKMLMYVAQTQLTVLKLISSAEREPTPLPPPSTPSLFGREEAPEPGGDAARLLPPAPQSTTEPPARPRGKRGRA